MSTLPFTSSTTDQVRLNLVHYNLWTQVEVHNNYILSGLPPTKLVSTDPDSKREWIVCKRLNEQSKLKVKEINSWFEEIKQFTNGNEEKRGNEFKLDVPSEAHLQSQDTTENSKQAETEDVSSSSTHTGPASTGDSKPHPPNSIWKPIDKTMNGKGRVDRITIALINDDGTIVYYFIHDGITKPRQN